MKVTKVKEGFLGKTWNGPGVTEWLLKGAFPARSCHVVRVAVESARRSRHVRNVGTRRVGPEAPSGPCAILQQLGGGRGGPLPPHSAVPELQRWPALGGTASFRSGNSCAGAKPVYWDGRSVQRLTDSINCLFLLSPSFYTPGRCPDSVQDGAGQLFQGTPRGLQWPGASGGVPWGPRGLGTAFQGNSQWKVAIRKCDAFERPVWFPAGGFHAPWHTRPLV